MTRKALIVAGGWDGHRPAECAALFKKLLEATGMAVAIETRLDILADTKALLERDLIIPMWTMGALTGEQEGGLCEAVRRGVGLAGFHGGMGDAFRNNTNYQFMVGGQFVSHPGGCQPMYTIRIVDPTHAITRDVDDFVMTNTEQYYMHVDPSNNVLAETVFANGVIMPAAWTRMWGEGRVFYASWGHTENDFDEPAARDIVRRGMIWAAR